MSKAKKEILYEGIKLDSKEELEFIYWLEDAKKLGYFSKIIYHPKPYELIPKQTIKAYKTLKTRIKEIEIVLFQPHTFQADFYLVPTDKFPELNLNWHIQECETNPFIIVDIKGTYNQKNTHRIFSTDQKLMYLKHGIYVEKVILSDIAQKDKATGQIKVLQQGLFNQTWVPELCAFNKRTKERRKPYVNCKLLKEVIN